MQSIATWTLAAALTFGADATPFTAHALLDSPSRHVRLMDQRMRPLLRAGYEHSPTFAALLARLQRSDVYVYVDVVARLPGSLEGRLLVLPPSHGVRYVRIQIALRGSQYESIAVLGHELRHAVEVADAPDVLDADGLVTLYRRIGIERGQNEFDTQEAQETGRRVLKELIA